MPPLAIALLIVAAFLHAAWNLLLKQADEKYLVTWWALLIGSALMLPGMAFTGPPARAVWPLLLASAVVEVVYFVVLAAGYAAADFSLIYPIGRGAAPALVVLWALLFLGEKLTVGGGIGLFTIVAGLLIVGGSDWLSQKGKTPSARGTGLALLLALTISIYTVIDGAAVKQTSPYAYTVMIFLLGPIFGTPLVLRRYGWRAMKSVWKEAAWRVPAIGVLTVLAYLLVLAAYAIAPVNYSAAIREVSVVIAAFAGWKFLHERLGGVRLIGAVVLFCGILIIAVFA